MGILRHEWSGVLQGPDLETRTFLLYATRYWQACHPYETHLPRQYITGSCECSQNEQIFPPQAKMCRSDNPRPTSNIHRLRLSTYAVTKTR